MPVSCTTWRITPTATASRSPGQPGGPVLNGGAVFLAWFRRQDGVAMLVTDIGAPEKMQTVFYGRKDGSAGAVAADLAKNYLAKMASYPAFGPGP